MTSEGERSGLPRTAPAIREALEGEGRVYLRSPSGTTAQRVFNAKTCGGVVRVKLQWGWHTLVVSDEIWSVE